MLRIHPGNMYIVYPSWADFSYGWDRLPTLMADPLESGFLDKGKNWASYGFPMQVQPFELFGSRAGNGIVVAHTDGARWLPEQILGKEADILAPDHIDRMMSRFDPEVYYLHPRTTDDVLLGIRRAPKRYLCTFGIEAADLAPGEVCWVMISKGTVPEETEDVQAIAADLGLALAPSTAAPSLSDHATEWLRRHGDTFAYFRGHSEIEDAGFHLAALYYTGLFLKKRSPRRFMHLCLVANVEGRPSTSAMLWRRGDATRA